MMNPLQLIKYYPCIFGIKERRQYNVNYLTKNERETFTYSGEPS